jgi:hypothetical protein
MEQPMKTAIILAAALAATSANAEFYTGNDLLSKIDASNTFDNMLGLGYVMGVFDTARGVEHCPPDNITAGQVRDMVRQHLVNSPSIRNITADLQVRYVLKTAWPCAKKSSGSNL